ncbi:putative mitochondrial protein, partial [Mucuna pruriens]
MVLLIYVYVIVVTSFDQKKNSKLKQILHSTFHMKGLGHLTNFLGLELAKLTNSTPVDTPFEVNVKYKQEEGDIFYYSTLYCKLVGSLICVTIAHPDISFVYNESLDISLSPQSVVGCPDTRKSTIGWCMFLGIALISWKCKKQDSVSKSSTKVKYHAISIVCSEIIWLYGLLIELGFPQT